LKEDYARSPKAREREYAPLAHQGEKNKVYDQEQCHSSKGSVFHNIINALDVRKAKNSSF
jgi:hypothetical protein